MLTDKEQEEIRRKLLGLEVEPPAAAWQKIAADIKPPRNKRPLWWIFAAALLLLCVSVGLYLSITTNQRAEEISDTTEGATQQDTSTGTIVGTKKPVTASTQKSIATGNARSATGTMGSDKLENTVKSETGHQTIATEINTTTEPIITPGRTKQRVKVPISVIAGAEKPKYKAKDKYNNEESSTAKTVAADKYKPAAITIAEQQEPTVEQEPAQPINSSTTNNYAQLLLTKQTQPQETKGFSVPDSVSITTEADSLLKKLASLQAENSKENKQSEWYMGVHVASRYAFRTFTPTASDEVYITKLNDYETVDPNRLGYEFALNAGKQLKTNLFLETSISLMQLREDVTYTFTNGKVDTLISSRKSNGSYQATPVYIQNQRQLKSAYTYGGLRIGVNYYFLQSSRRRLNLTFAGGANLLLKGRTTEYINGINTGTVLFPSEDSPLEQTNYNLLIGAGYNMTLPKNFELTLMPNLNYFLGSTFSNREPFGLRPYTLGLSLQVKKRFIK